MANTAATNALRHRNPVIRRSTGRAESLFRVEEDIGEVMAARLQPV